ISSAAARTQTADGSDYYLAPSPSPRDLCPGPAADSCSHSADGSRQRSGARLALCVALAAVVCAPAVVLASAAAVVLVIAAAAVDSAALAAYCPGDFALHWRAVLAQGTAQGSPRSGARASSIPRIEVYVSFLVTSADSGWCRFLLRPAPAAAIRSAAQNPKSHHNFLAPTYSG